MDSGAVDGMELYGVPPPWIQRQADEDVDESVAVHCDRWEPPRWVIADVERKSPWGPLCAHSYHLGEAPLPNRSFVGAVVNDRVGWFSDVRQPPAL